MGTKLRDLAVAEEITFDDLGGKVLAVDTYNLLYQFLTSIRMRDGSLLQDSKGRVVSHLQGLLSRTAILLEKNIRPVFVFDGKPPVLKEQERLARRKTKEQAEQAFELARERGDEEEMKKYASMGTRLTPDIIASAQELIRALGCPIVLAPSEGEAQAAYLVMQGDAFAAVSQDFDSLLFGAERLVRNFSAAGKRKKANSLSYVTVKPELISLAETLNTLGIDREGLIVLGMLAGTDYNKGGIRGLGPKKALKAVKEAQGDWDALFEKVKWSDTFSWGWREVFTLFKEMPVEKNYTLTFRAPDENRILDFLCREHDFSEERVRKTLKKIAKTAKKTQVKGLGQKGLDEFF